jgi:hypothetical protein
MAAVARTVLDGLTEIVATMESGKPLNGKTYANLRRLAESIKALNITSDQGLDEAFEALDSALREVDLERAKTDPKARAALAQAGKDAMKAIDNDMGAFM